jgi:2-polyprenyl-3-methyl-5-hydroxy-6-metoxy-1,4-benzoquinol methylase
MLALRKLPKSYREWNLTYGSPYGHSNVNKYINVTTHNFKTFENEGPFSVQENNTTRVLEYPWAFFSTSIKKDLNVLDIGGGLCGFQFVLAKNGCKVINIDPGTYEDRFKWLCTQESIRILNNIFSTNVTLLNTTLDKANIECNSVDRIFALSILEHLSKKEIKNIMDSAYNLLKPGGYFIITLDLFLNLYPFCSRQKNKFGKNINVKDIIEMNPFKIYKGEKTELYGYPEFNSDNIISNLGKYNIGVYYPCLAQCIVLQK